MIGVVIPAHNEARLLGDCVRAVLAAAQHEALAGEAVRVTVVLDDCTDASQNVAAALGADTLHVNARNVGVARAAGADALLAQGARWLAFTDADTRVSHGWLAAQLAHHCEGADAVCGPVSVDDWSEHGEHAQNLSAHFAATYHDRDGHRHIHGANLGVAAGAYRRAGGFPPLACSEDVALVEALLACGANVAWSASPRVVTSARTDARARGGFGDTLLAVVRQAAAIQGPALPFGHGGRDPASMPA